jgi:hypothetical protein
LVEDAGAFADYLPALARTNRSTNPGLFVHFVRFCSNLIDENWASAIELSVVALRGKARWDIGLHLLTARTLSGFPTCRFTLPVESV